MKSYCDSKPSQGRIKVGDATTCKEGKPETKSWRVVKKLKDFMVQALEYPQLPKALVSRGGTHKGVTVYLLEFFHCAQYILVIGL